MPGPFFSGRRRNTQYAHARIYARSHATFLVHPRHCYAALLFFCGCIYLVVVLPAIENQHVSHCGSSLLFFFLTANIVCQSMTRCFDVFAIEMSTHAFSHAPIWWIFTHYFSPFFRLSGRSRRDFVGPPRVLDSAVLISELWAHRGNSHPKNGFFRPSGAVIER